MEYKFLTDQALLEALAKNDAAAMNEIYRLYAQPMVRWISNRGGIDADAEDAFQEAVLVLYEKAKDPGFCLTVKIGTYLFAVCKRLWMKRINTRSNADTYYTDDIEMHWGEAAYEEEDIQRLREKEAQFEQLAMYMDKLGSPCNELLKDFYIENKSMQDIATKYGYTNAENAKTQKYKCLIRLKKMFFEGEKKKVSHKE